MRFTINASFAAIDYLAGHEPNCIMLNPRVRLAIRYRGEDDHQVCLADKFTGISVALWP